VIGPPSCATSLWVADDLIVHPEVVENHVARTVAHRPASINQANPTPPPGNGQLVGTYKGSVDILGVQFAYRF